MLWWTLWKLHAPAPHIRATAAEVLGYSRDKRAVPSLMAALQDDHASVRKAAAEALGQLRDLRAVDSLVAALQDEYREVREGAAWGPWGGSEMRARWSRSEAPSPTGRRYPRWR
jgi:HEAT repeats